jgi:hypothetical protein
MLLTDVTALSIQGIAKVVYHTSLTATATTYDGKEVHNAQHYENFPQPNPQLIGTGPSTTLTIDFVIDLTTLKCSLTVPELGINERQ